MSKDRPALSTIHNIAAACQLWARTRPESSGIRSVFGVPRALGHELEIDALALGFIDRVCQVFAIDPSDRELITYIFLLLDGHGSCALDRLKKLTDSLTDLNVGGRIKEGAGDADKLLNSVLLDDVGRSA